MGLDRRITSFVEYQLENFNNRAEIEKQRKKLIEFSHASAKPAETAAVSIVSDLYLQYSDITHGVIDYVLSRLDQIDKTLIRLLYFDKSHTVAGAGAVIGLSPAQAYRHRNVIIKQIAEKLGYIPK